MVRINLAATLLMRKIHDMLYTLILLLLLYFHVGKVGKSR